MKYFLIGERIILWLAIVLAINALYVIVDGVRTLDSSILSVGYALVSK